MTAASFPSLLQGFFTDRLLRQRQASPHTIASYRDTFRLLLRFAADQLRKAPSVLKTEDIEPAFIGRFLEHLEQGRGNSRCPPSRGASTGRHAAHAAQTASPAQSPRYRDP